MTLEPDPTGNPFPQPPPPQPCDKPVEQQPIPEEGDGEPNFSEPQEDDL